METTSRMSARFNASVQSEFIGDLTPHTRNSYCMGHYELAETLRGYLPPWETRECDSALLHAIAAGVIPTRGRALELGCGYGYSTTHLSTLGFTRVVGVDLSIAAIRRARRRASRSGICNVTRFVCYDAYDLPSPHTPFDFVYDNTIFNNTGVHTARTVEDYTSMLDRVLAPGGTFLLVFAIDDRSRDGLSTRFPGLPVPSRDHIRRTFGSSYAIELVEDGIQYDLVEVSDPRRPRIPHAGGYAIMKRR